MSAPWTKSYDQPRQLIKKQSHYFANKGLERLLLKEKTLGFLASGGEEFNPGPEMRLDCSELLCNKILLKHNGDRESV